MNTDLVKFLSTLKIEGSDQYYTNGCQMLPNTGKYKIERNNLEEFWELYQDLLFKLKDDFMAGINERPSEFMPILGDIDIAIPYNDDEDMLSTPLYNFRHVKEIISIYLDVIKSVLPNDYDPEHLYCFLLEKPTPYVSGERIKHGFHLHFPFLFMSNVDQDMHIIPRIRKRVSEEKLFEDIGILRSEDTIDKSCSRQHWLLYGSRKDIKLHKYTLTKVFNHKGDIVTLERAMKNNKIYDINEDELVFEKPLEYYLPRILSISSLNKKIYEAKNSIKIIPKEELKKAKESRFVVDNLSVSQALKIAEKLMPLIADSRAENHDTKMEIGWILYNITDGSEEGLDLWLDFLQRCPEKYNEAKAIYRWTREMKKKNYTVGSLRYIARKDNPERYEDINRDEQKELLYKSLLGGHRDIAVQLYEKYGGQFVCADIDKKIWFEFREHRWVRVQSGITLRAKISSEILPRYVEEGSKMFKQAGDEEVDLENSKDNTSKVKQFFKVISSLKTAPFKDNIMRECLELFYKEDFLEKLDRNIYLTGFNNGVLDVKNMEFRGGRPDDYISLTTGYDWKEFEDDDTEVIECKDFLLKLFPNPLIRRYAIEYLATILKSGNFQKTFVIMTGEGDNGKSVFIEILEKVLGEYMDKLPTSLITSVRTQSSGSTMDTELLRKKKFCALQETSKKDQINDGKLKELTGNDSFQSRAHYGAFSKVEATAKIALICNKLPLIGSDDPAIWNRVRVLPFESKFPKNNDEVPLTFEEQIQKKIFHRDNNFSEKIPSLRQAFVWLMFQTYKYVSRHGYSKEPQQVTEATENYKMNNDTFLQFTNERIVKDESEDSEGITLTEVHNIYKEWYKETFGHLNNCPNKNELKEYLYKKWGVARLNKWKKYRMRTLRDDEVEGEALALREEDYTDTE